MQFGWRKRVVKIGAITFRNQPETQKDKNTKGLLIVTNDGLKPIQKITEGNKVLTHKGRFCPVTKTYKRDYIGKLVGLKAKGFEEVFATPNHPFLSTKAIKLSSLNW